MDAWRDLSNEMPVRKLPFKLLKEITNNFNEDRIIGSGAYGHVYKGEFEDGEVIAIKKLHFRIETDDEQFENELEHLTRLRYGWNIVKLVGFCNEMEQVWMPYEGEMVLAEETNRALCLEFVPKGGLGKFLKDDKITWEERFSIICGICEGLKCIHEASIVHLDLKPDNILLDDKMRPKIADFGISRLLVQENDETRSPLGTFGFIPPEFIDEQIISRQYDIFSLGAIIKKIMTGLTGHQSLDDVKKYIEHVRDNSREMFPKVLTNNGSWTPIEKECREASTCIEIALDCMEEDRLRRPTIDVVCRRFWKFEIGGDIHAAEQAKKFENVRLDLFIEKDFGQSRLEGEDKRAKKKLLLRARELPLGFLCEITNDFSQKRIISISAFATVFKGILHSGEEIAVKRFNVPKMGVLDEFLNKDGDFLGIIEHESIVQLVGFCCEWKRKVVKIDGKFIVTHELENLLCYEYVPNGSLDKYIYGDSYQLDWNMRFKIIMRICEALHFLHTELHRPISNLSLAPGNILLDKNMMPKLSDVGILDLPEGAKTFKPYQLSEYDQPDRFDDQYPHGPDDDMDEREYVAPEHEPEDISFQLNIYSLGVLIMQITAGNEFYNTVLAKWTDQYIASNFASLGATGIHQIKLCIQTGLACIQLDRGKRPSIQEIVKTLDSKYGSTLNKDITSSSTTSLSHLMSSLQDELSSYRSREVFVEEISQESTAELAGKDLE